MSNDEIAALQTKIDFLLDALQKIIACLPAIQDGGGFIVEHFDMDGEYMGSQEIDPYTVVQGRMVKDNNARIVQTLVAQVDRLTADRDACRKLVMEHNAQLQDDCESRACDSDMRQCGDCPVRVFGIDVPPELEQSP